jgi:hypothetical protein
LSGVLEAVDPRRYPENGVAIRRVVLRHREGRVLCQRSQEESPRRRHVILLVVRIQPLLVEAVCHQRPRGDVRNAKIRRRAINIRGELGGRAVHQLERIATLDRVRLPDRARREVASQYVESQDTAAPRMSVPSTISAAPACRAARARRAASSSLAFCRPLIS